MDILKERYSLVQERLVGISEETAALLADFQSEDKRYWHLCAELALGREIKDVRFLDYVFCESVFGERGRYLCLLFAQMMQVPGFYRKKEPELVCICCELLAEVYRMTADGEEVKAIRNTLYWFYSDYCEVYSKYWLNELYHNQTVVFNGPMLCMDCSEVYSESDSMADDSKWMQHTGDFGLYMGSRFEERCYQAVMLAAKDGRAEVCWRFAEMLCHTKELDMVSGFKPAERQQEGLLHLASRIQFALSMQDNAGK